MIVQAIHSFDVDDRYFDNRDNIKRLCEDVAKRDMESLLVNSEISSNDFSS